MRAFDFGHTEKLPVSLLATDQRTKYAERQRAFKERTKAILSTSYNSGDDYYDNNDDDDDDDDDYPSNLVVPKKNRQSRDN